MLNVFKKNQSLLRPVAIKELWENAKSKIIIAALFVAGLATFLTNTKSIIGFFDTKRLELVDLSFITIDSLDIKFHNRGTEAAVVKRIIFEAQKKWTLAPDDIGKGFMVSSATYNLSLNTEKDPPYTLSHDLSQIIEGGKTDRFQIRVGVQESPTRPAAAVIISGNLVIEFDKNKQFKGRKIFFYLPEKNAIYSSPTSAVNLKALTEIDEENGLKSKELTEFIHSHSQ